MSFWDNVKKFAQPYADDDYDDYGDEMDDGFPEEETESTPRFSNRDTASAGSGFSAPLSTPSSTAFASSAASGVSTGFSGQVINTASSKQQVVLTRPDTFNDATVIASELRNKKAVVLNLENVDKALARRVVDFLSGCAFSLDGSVKKISSSTYLFCPYNMEVTGDLKNLQGEVESYI